VDGFEPTTAATGAQWLSTFEEDNIIVDSFCRRGILVSLV